MLGPYKSILSGPITDRNDMSWRKTDYEISINEFDISKALDLYVNVLHAFKMPGIDSRHKAFDIVRIRENSEGEFEGIEHEIEKGLINSIKVITHEGSKRIAEYAFEYASLNKRKKVSAIHNTHILKITDGMFINACREVAERYNHIEYEEMIVDVTH